MPSTATEPSDLSTARVLLLDNYDSFTYNVYQMLCELGAPVTVLRNDKITLEECIALNPTHLLVSPGPGHPKTDAGICLDAIAHFAGKIPVFGVCFGMQSMYHLYGGTVDVAGEIFHGKASTITHDGKGTYAGVPSPLSIIRYHSLVGTPETLPDCLEVTSRTDNGLIMGVRHKTYMMEGVQYHPESFMSEGGLQIFKNFLLQTSGMREKPPPSILDKIYVQRRLDVATAREKLPLAALKERLPSAPPLINFLDRLNEAAPMAVIAEIKRASPSKGVIAAGVVAGTQASKYSAAGAAAISVLTEPTWFHGTLQDMLDARLAVDGVHRPAILRKDFIIDEYQVVEARVYGADTLLLIVACLSDAELTTLMAASRALGMEPLVEVNNEAEMVRAMAVGAKVVGVNNRNLHNFDVDMKTTDRVAASADTNAVLLAALSGISSRADVEHFAAVGARAVLVGESLMRAEDTGAAVRALLGL